MIILTDKMLVIPVGISPNYNSENKPSLEDKSVEITKNGDYSYTADEAYYGIGNFNVKVNVEIPVESEKTVYPSFNEDVTVVPSEGFDAMSSVIVKKAEANLQDKTVDKASESQIVLTADEGYQGLGTVTIAPIKTRVVTVIPSSQQQIITADTNNNEYLRGVMVNGVMQKTLTADPSTNEQTFNSNNLFGEFYSKVVVNPVTSSIDSNIVPDNIAKGVSILGVNGTLDAALPSELQEIINKGPAYSSKIQVYSVYTEDKSTTYDPNKDSLSGAAGASGYIPFFMKKVKFDDYHGGYPNTDTLANSLGTIADRGIVAYTVNGVLYTNPTSFNIPYTKVNDGNKNYDDVTIDVYIDFTKANARAEIIENTFLSENGGTTPVDPSLFDVNTYRYLPPIINSNINEHRYFDSNFNVMFLYKIVETYIEQINALSALFICGYHVVNQGNMTFFLSEDGIKRVPDALSQKNSIRFNKVSFYGNVNNYKNIKYWFNETQSFYVYGNVNGFEGVFYESSNYFGNVKTPNTYYKKYNGKILDIKEIYEILDIGENIDTNKLSWDGSSINPWKGVSILPASLKYLYDNNKGRYDSSYRSSNNNIIYVFFGATPPTMPADQDSGNPQLLLQTGTTNISYNNLTTIYKPAGADYSSIIDPTNPPTVIDFTPISSMSEVAGPGIYGLTYGDKGYHWLFEIKDNYHSPSKPTILTDTYVKPSEGAIVPTDIKLPALHGVKMYISGIDAFDEALDSTVAGQAALDIVKDRVMIGASPDFIAPFNHLDYERNLPRLPIDESTTAVLGDSSIAFFHQGGEDGYGGISYSALTEFGSSHGGSPQAIPSLNGEHIIDFGLKYHDNDQLWMYCGVDNQGRALRLYGLLSPDSITAVNNNKMAPLCIFGTYNYVAGKTPDDVIALGYQNALKEIGYKTGVRYAVKQIDIEEYSTDTGDATAEPIAKLHSLVPARDSNGTICLYDTITEKSYYPFNGTLDVYTPPVSEILTGTYVKPSAEAIVPTDIKFTSLTNVTMHVKGFDNFDGQSDLESILTYLESRAMIGAQPNFIVSPFNRKDAESFLPGFGTPSQEQLDLLSDSSIGINFNGCGNYLYSIVRREFDDGTPQILSIDGEHVITVGYNPEDINNINMDTDKYLFKIISIDGQGDCHTFVGPATGIYKFVDDQATTPICIFGNYNNPESMTPDDVIKLGYQNALKQIGYVTGARYGVKQIDIAVRNADGSMTTKHSLVPAKDTNNKVLLYDTITKKSYYPFHGTLDII